MFLSGGAIAPHDISISPERAPPSQITLFFSAKIQ